jgi:aryl-alcohol dehydrogenase-like predicted oxidoreductase
MRYKLLGSSGLRVSELCLGTMTFGDEWGWGASQAQSAEIFHAFAEAGGNFIDTADVYTNGTSEKCVGELIGSRREYFVLATKYTNAVSGKDPNAAGNHRKNMIQSVEASLKRLRVDYIDLYWLHVWEFTTSVEEVMRALDDLVRTGKILYVGVSDTPAWIVSRANMLAALRGWTPFVAIQVEYNLIERSAERELLPMARALDLAVTPWSPLASGLLTGKYTAGGRPQSPRRLDKAAFKEISERNLAIAREADAVAAEVGRSSAQVALAWLRQQPGIMIPILGARTLDQIKDNMGCLDLTLSPEQIRRLEDVSRIDLGFPHDFITNPMVRGFAYGGMFEHIDNHHLRNRG